MDKETRIRVDDLTDEGVMLYAVILLLDELSKAPDRNTESFTVRINNTRNLLIAEITS